ncbi:maleylpyruvate isomerase family mycothiol-dependent enzyme [Fodinicola acaciae]|uniref:maleylpyruvate isomerase family mycothiol-dependent enzyme n=1 Tax=Fodinicola acaciae TaxID=2681555 RepID=UPI0013D44D50|nr:maleylpyruvate isomerase family mycothiol-dependent enzyme [Fodinicola acaciae]
MDTEEWIAAVADAGVALTAAARAAGLAAQVPSCPGWQVRDLLVHTGAVHHWAATIVRTPVTEPWDPAEPTEAVDALPADADLLDWYLDSNTALVRALTSAPAGLECWTFQLSMPGRDFWSRRQAHEATVHRVDAELAAGRSSEVPADLAHDGIDELLTGFLPRGRRARDQAPRTLAVDTTDTGGHWLVRFGDGPATAARHDQRQPADERVDGPAAELYLQLWNRKQLDNQCRDLVKVRW